MLRRGHNAWLRTWKVVVPSVTGATLMFTFWDDISERLFPNKPKASAVALTPEPTKPLDESVDLDALERKYPFGFLVFRENKADSRWDNLGRNIEFECYWDRVRCVRFSNGDLRVRIPVAKLVVKEHHLEFIDGALGLYLHKTKAGKVYDLSDGPYKLLTFDKIGLAFEILSDHPRRPIYVLGFRERHHDSN